MRLFFWSFFFLFALGVIHDVLYLVCVDRPERQKGTGSPRSQRGEGETRKLVTDAMHMHILTPIRLKLG